MLETLVIEMELETIRIKAILASDTSKLVYRYCALTNDDDAGRSRKIVPIVQKQIAHTQRGKKAFKLPRAIRP